MKRAIIAVIVIAAVGGAFWKYNSGTDKRSRGRQGRFAEAVVGPIEQSIDATGSVAPRVRWATRPARVTSRAIR